MFFLLFVAKLKSFFARGLNYAPAMAGAGAIALFLWICSQFYLPGQGFSYLIQFGSRNHDQYLPELRAVNHYEIQGMEGYDGQAYAQLAMRPDVRSPALARAVDDLPYRARRILLSWTAYLIAGGDPVRALHVFAVQNLVAWLALAVLLWRWFPLNGWGNFGRWAGVLFCFGLCTSVRGSLVDGPSLLLIAGAAALVESGRTWLGAGLLGLAGLAKDTNLMAGAALLPAGEPRASWRRAWLQGALAALPLLAWTLLLAHWLGTSSAGVRNFGFPLEAYWGKWMATLEEWGSRGFNFQTRGDLLVLVALTTQALFIAMRPRVRELWWRIGAAYAFLMVFLGRAVWEGFPGRRPACSCRSPSPSTSSCRAGGPGGSSCSWAICRCWFPRTPCRCRGGRASWCAARAPCGSSRKPAGPSRPCSTAPGTRRKNPGWNTGAGAAGPRP